MKLKFLSLITITLLLFGCSSMKKTEKSKVVVINLGVPDGWRVDTLTESDKKFLDSLDRAEGRIKQ